MKTVKRSFAGFLSLFLFLSQCVLAHAYETNVWGERRAKSVQLASVHMFLAPSFEALPLAASHSLQQIGVALSPAWGQIRKTVFSSRQSNQATVVFIQDIHMNLEAQMNIAKTVEALLKTNQVEMVALEGESTMEDLANLQKFYDQRASNFNIEAYRQSVIETQHVKAALEKAANDLKSRKEKHMNAQLQAFDAAVTAYRSGEMERGDYARHLLREVEGLDMDAVLADMKQIEQDVFERLIDTADERNLVDESYQLSLMTKLVDFNLSTDEWKAYKEEMGNWKLDHASLVSFENFYHEAEVRDEVMADNLITAMKTKQVQVAMLVANGFHAPGIMAKLEKAGINIINFVPKPTQTENENDPATLRIFTRHTSQNMGGSTTDFN